MYTGKTRVSTGIEALDQRLDGLFIGDNVIWYDEAGSLAFPFCLNFIQESQNRDRPFIYVTFDRSPKTLLEELGPLAQCNKLIILDCFTHGKGDGSPVFARFYDNGGNQRPCQVIRVTEPHNPKTVSDAIYEIHQNQQGDVCFVFESLTGMQDLWEGEEHVLKFYSRSCPRLYELETIAYWIIEKGAHTSRLKAHINQIAQVAIGLGLRRGKSTLTVIKAHNRHPDSLNKPEAFWSDGMAVSFDIDKPVPEKTDLGARLKALRTSQGLAQKDLAARIGVTSSTISQIESSLIFPSLPALFRIAQIFSVDVGYFFQKNDVGEQRMVFSGKGNEIHFQQFPKNSIKANLVFPKNTRARVEPYVMEIPPGKRLSSHFFAFKGEEFGYLLEGELQMVINDTVHTLVTGDVMYLTNDMPSQWKNSGKKTAKLLWLKIL
jgi:transcriptional regulator with XRE-family HTH domain/KaiC/GvpD/RAD55 family RecA-like ATPase